MSGKRRQRRQRNQQRKVAAVIRSSQDAEPAPASTREPSSCIRRVVNVNQAAGPHVVVAIASTGQIHEQTLGSVQAMVRATRKAASVEMWWQNAYPGGHCRNLLVDCFLADKSKTHLLFVDTDMVVPANGLDLLLETNEPLVCGPAPVCPRRKADTPRFASPFELTSNIMDVSDPALRGLPTEPEDTAMAYTRRDYGSLPDTLFTCDVTGMSFCLIARDILERMTPPWFYFLDLPDRTTIGLDVYFFRKAGLLGYRVAVHPQAMCDHVKRADITHLEQLMVARAPEPRWNWAPRSQTPRTMVVACTSRRWLDLRTAEILLCWQQEPDNRVGVRLIDSSDVQWALARFLHEPAAEPSWERIMLLSPDVVPTGDLVHRLGSIDAPIVSTLNRTLIDGDIAYTFARRDPQTGRIEHPTQLSLTDITGPFEAHTVDLACSVIKRDTCKHVPEALRFAVDQPDPMRAFSRHFCDLVRQETGRNPVVAPVVVERRADVGLLGLLHLKHKIQTEQASRAPAPQPVCV